MKLRAKILIYILLSIIVVFTITVGWINIRYNNLMKNMAHQIADLYAEQSANTAQAILNGDLKMMLALESVFPHYINLPENLRKKLILDNLTDILEKNNQFLASWLSLELSVLDTSWHYSYGRIRYICYWDKGVIKTKIDSVNTDGDDYNSVYYLMKINDINVLTDPYLFSYSNDTASTYLETSIGTGIWKNGQFIGAVGVDVSFDRFKMILEKISPFANSTIFIVSNDGTIVAHTDNELIRQNLKKILPEDAYSTAIIRIKKGKAFNLNLEIKRRSYYIAFYPIKVEGTLKPWALGFMVPNSVILEEVKNNTIISIVLSVAGLIMILFIIWIFATQIIRPIEKATDVIERLGYGEIDESMKIKLKRRDELGVMANAINKLIDALDRTVEFAVNIGKGKLDVKYQLLSPNDKLGHALLEMQQNIIKSRELEAKQREEREKLSWTQSGLSELNEILRLKSENLDSLSYEVLKFLIDYLKANQGGFYTIERHENKDIIVLKAAYAFERRKQITAEIEIGEGLIGRAVKEKIFINLDDLPEGYTFITSGLGQATPKHLVIFPLIFEDQVYGAVEILSFDKLEDYQIEFLKQASERIASTVSIIKKNIETQELLKQLQLQTATFEMKEKQFARLNKRLKQMQKEIELQKIEVEMIFDAFSMIASVIELDNEKKIRSINNILPQALDLEPEAFIGKEIGEFQYKRYGKKWMEQFWKDLFNGIVRRKHSHYKYNNKEAHFEEVYIPVLDKNTLKKIVVIGIG